MRRASELRVAAADRARCRALLARGSASFSAAARLLPARLVDPATFFYAFCRVADDAIDDSDDPAALADLTARVDAIFAGAPRDDAVDRAFAEVVRAHDLPRALVDALLEGFAWDRAGRTYETLADVRAYGARVAGAVGAAMTIFMGPRDAVTLARACDLGVAMQLTNIARDVGEDARNGRVYLPQRWLREAGLTLDRAPAFTPALGRLTARLLDEAGRLYARSEEGIDRLPRDCRPAIWAARLVYADIGTVIRKHAYDSVTSRARTTTGRKIALLGASLALAQRRASVPAGDEPPLPETAFLVEAARR